MINDQKKEPTALVNMLLLFSVGSLSMSFNDNQVLSANCYLKYEVQVILFEIDCGIFTQIYMNCFVSS